MRFRIIDVHWSDGFSNYQGLKDLVGYFAIDYSKKQGSYYKCGTFYSDKQEYYFKAVHVEEVE